ncbi:unnamed protein product [Peniophora sp. CBMAI 1063]|nr:unnamed protein product [Peniophora sp. CBMAI 1063]
MEDYPGLFLNVDRIFNSDSGSDVSDDSDDHEHFYPIDPPWVVRAWDDLSIKPLPDNIKVIVEDICKALWRKGKLPMPSSVHVKHSQVFEVEISEEDRVLLQADMSGTAANTLNSSSAAKNSAHNHTNGERKPLGE